MAYYIRDAREEDIEAMTALLDRLFAIETDYIRDPGRQRAGLRMLLHDWSRSTVKVAVALGRVVGMCTAQISISTAEGGWSARVEDLVVDEHCRRRGIGGALLAETGRWAGEHGCMRLQLLADTANQPALAFYRRNAWCLTRMICLEKKIRFASVRRNVSGTEKERAYED